MARPKKKVNKISEEDQQKLQQYVGALGSISKEIGAAEIKKLALASRHSEIQNQFNQFSAGLEHKYGKVSIDIETGEYKTPEELEKENESDKKD